MGRKRKEMKDLQFSNLEFSYQPGFEQDWAKVMADILFHQIKDEIQKGDVMIP